MAVVIGVGRDVTYYEIDDNSSRVSIKEQNTIIKKFSPELFKNKASAFKFFKQLVDYRPDFMKEGFYIFFAPGSGILFSTMNIARENLIDPATSSTPEEQEDGILKACEAFLPVGADDFYKNYRTSVDVSYDRGSEFCLSTSFLPSEFVETIVDACEELELNLMYLGSVSYGLHNALSFKGGQYIFESENAYVLANQMGLIVWEKPEVPVMKNLVLEHLYRCADKVFGRKDSASVTQVCTTIGENTERNDIAKGIYTIDQLSALGLCIDYMDKSKEKDTANAVVSAESSEGDNGINLKKGGGQGDFTSRLRKLLGKK